MDAPAPSEGVVGEGDQGDAVALYQGEEAVALGGLAGVAVAEHEGDLGVYLAVLYGAVHHLEQLSSRLVPAGGKPAELIHGFHPSVNRLLRSLAMMLLIWVSGLVLRPYTLPCFRAAMKSSLPVNSGIST